MAKKTQPRKDRKVTELRTLTTDQLQAAIGGWGIPGQLKSSSGGGGTSS